MLQNVSQNSNFVSKFPDSGIRPRRWRGRFNPENYAIVQNSAITDPGLRDPEFRLLQLIKTLSRDGEVEIEVGYLANRMKRSPEWVRKWKRSLIAKGRLQSIAQYDPVRGDQIANLYRVLPYTPPLYERAPQVLRETQNVNTKAKTEYIKQPAAPSPKPVPTKPRSRHIAISCRIARKFCSDRHIASPWERQRLTQRIEDLLNAGGVEETIVADLDREHREKVERAQAKPHRGTHRSTGQSRRDAAAARLARDNYTCSRQPTDEERAQQRSNEEQRVKAHLEASARALEASSLAPWEGCRTIVETLRKMDPGSDMQSLEDRLVEFEDRLFGALAQGAPKELLDKFSENACNEVAAYRGRMRASELEKTYQQFVRKQLMRYYSVPRLSLFYANGRTA